jgi:hypothetical protein
VIDRDRGNPTEIVDAVVEQPAGIRTEIGRGLEVDVAGQNQARDSDRPKELFIVSRRPSSHRRSRLGKEVLNDDFLDVAVSFVGLT